MASAKHEYHSFDCLVTAVKDIEELNSPQFRSITTLRIINSDTLLSMKGIGKFELLLEANLSANVIGRIEDLSPLRLLQRLDLSCNRIRVLAGVKGLPHLAHLNLSGNKITSMKPLEEVCLSGSRLAFVDLSGNSLHDLRELALVPKLVSLKSLVLHQDEEFSNPFCANRAVYVNTVKKLPLREEFQIDNTYFVDFKSINPEIEGLLRPPPTELAKPRAPQEPRSDSPGLPQRDTAQPSRPGPQPAPKAQAAQKPKGLEVLGRNIDRDSQSPDKPASPQPTRAKPSPANQRPREDPPAAAQPPDRGQETSAPGPRAPPPGSALQSEFVSLLGEADRLKESVKSLKEALSTLEREKRELEGRLAGGLRAEERSRVLVGEVEKTRSLLRAAQVDMEDLAESLSHEKKLRLQHEAEIAELKSREGSLAKRVEETLRRNVELTKEVEFAGRETAKSREEAAQLAGQVAELRRVIKGYESSLQSSHNESMKNNEMAIIRIEDLSARLRELEAKHGELKALHSQALEQKAQLFEEKVRLEASLANQVESLAMAHRAELGAAEADLKEKLQALKAFHADQLSQAAAAQESALSGLEAEFKSMVVSLTEKSKKSQEETRGLREALGRSAARVAELEELLGEMGAVIEGVRADVKEKQRLELEKARPGDSVPLQEYIKARDALGLKARECAELESRLKAACEELERKSRQAQEGDRLLESLRQEAAAREKEAAQLKRENQGLLLKLDEHAEAARRIEAKFHALESQRNLDEKLAEDELESLKTEVRIKAQLLNEKAAENERLRSEVAGKENLLSLELVRKSEVEESCNARVELEKLEYQKLRAKYQKKDQLLDEYEAQIEALQGELEAAEKTAKSLRQDLLEKGQLAEECLKRLEAQQGHKRAFEDAQANAVAELQRTVEGLSLALRQKDARVKELEAAAREAELAHRDRLRGLEDSNKALLQDNLVKEREVVTLLNEISKQKKLAKENLANLTRLFS